jgi:hypothetical protein
MGSDAEVYIFDHARFVTEVVPMVRTLLATGVVEPDVAALARELDRDPLPSLGGADLARDCTYLRVSDLALEQRVDRKDPWRDRWELRACTSVVCPSHVHCPFHLARRDATEDVISLIEALVVDRCLGPSQFVGRSVNVGYYRDLLQPSVFDEQHPLTPLLDALGRRGRVMGYTFANSDGIHGWLDPDETRALVRHMASLHLPEYEASFDAMEAFRRRLEGPHGGSSYEPPPEFTFEQLSLSYLRTVATIATQQQRGILWGNDLHHFRQSRDA